MPFQDRLKNISLRIDDKMKELLPADHGFRPEFLLFDAMTYSSLSEGKRLRPFLTLVSSSLFGVSEDSALRTACAIEFVHTYSLIHDDLPAIDNDNERRGKPSCHKKYGEDIALLAGDALLTLAFEILSDKLTHPDGNVRCELINSLAKAIGGYGMVGGQTLDLLTKKCDFSVNEMIRMQRMKTGELFAIACEAGSILGKASKNLRLALRAYALSMGLAFQITDDILDIEKDQEKNPNYNASDLQNSKEQSIMLINQAISHLNVFEEKAEPLRDLAKFILARNG